MISTNFNRKKYNHIIPSPKGYFVSTNKGVIVEINHEGKIITYFDAQTSADIEFIKFDEKERILYTSQGHFNYDNPLDFHGEYYGKGIGIDEFNNLYVGIHSLSFLRLKSNKIPFKIETFPYKPFDNHDYYDVIRKKRTRSVTYFNQGLYIAYVDKLLMYDKNGVHELKNKQGKPIYAIDLAHDDNNILWVATIQDGVYCFKDGKLIEHYHQQNGLDNNSCRKIRCYNNDTYVVTLNNVIKIEREKGILSNLSSRYSLKDFDIKDIIINQNNDLLLTTDRGLLEIKFEKNRMTPLPYITTIGLKTKNINEIKDNFTLPYSDNTVAFQWTLLNYQVGRSEPLFYRLKGLNEEWVSSPSNINSIIYNNLSPGKYSFEITFDKNSKSFHTIYLTVKKPFWLTGWFILLIIIGFTALFWFTIRTTRYFGIKKQRKKEALIISQLTAIRSQMNPHFLYNALNSLQGLIYSNKTNEAGNYVSMFSEHLRFTLEKSDKQWITVKEEAESLHVYLELEKLRFGDDFQYSILKSEEVLDYFKIPSMIIQPHVENAVKHGLLNKQGSKKVTVNFAMLNENTMEISIIDNGIGRKQSYIYNKQRKDKPKSFATQAIDARIDLLNERNKKPIQLKTVDLYEDGKATGTAVYFTIPIENE